MKGDAVGEGKTDSEDSEKDERLSTDCGEMTIFEEALTCSAALALSFPAGSDAAIGDENGAGSGKKEGGTVSSGFVGTSSGAAGAGVEAGLAASGGGSGQTMLVGSI